MCCSTISLVFRKPILGEQAVILGHHPVPRNLRYDTCSCYGNALRVAVNNADLRQFYLRDRNSVVEQDLRHDLKLSDCLAHRLIICLQYVDLIDPCRSDHARSPGECFVSHFIVQFFPALMRQFFGIIESQDLTVLRQDHRACNNRSCKRSSPRLINPADQCITLLLTVSLIGTHLLQTFSFLMQSVEALLRHRSDTADSGTLILSVFTDECLQCVFVCFSDAVIYFFDLYCLLHLLYNRLLNCLQHFM